MMTLLLLLLLLPESAMGRKRKDFPVRFKRRRLATVHRTDGAPRMPPKARTVVCVRHLADYEVACSLTGVFETFVLPNVKRRHGRWLMLRQITNNM